MIKFMRKEIPHLKKKNPMEFFNILKFHINSYEGFDYFK